MARRLRSIGAALLVAGLPATAPAVMVFEGLSGPVTSNEIAQFRSHVQGLALPGSVGTSDFAYGGTAQRTDSMGLMYEMTKDKALLDTMLRWTDRILSLRNNPNTGTIDWTGNRELIWKPEEQRSGAEQGAIAGHISYAAQIILQNPSLWGQSVGSGNPYGYGATYKQRADRYVAEMDKTEDTFLTKWYVRSSDSRYYFPTDSRYDGGNRGAPIAFNQGWMLSFNKLRLAKCHEILGNSTRAARYRQIVQVNLTWYTSEFDPWTAGGQPASLWYYDPIVHSQKEDLGHAQMGIQGMHRLDMIGGYSTYPDRVRMANTIRYAVYKPATDQWSHKIDGTNRLRDETYPSYILLSRWVSSLYSIVANDQISAGSISGDVESVAYLLWAKQSRYTGSWTQPTWGSSPTPTPTARPRPTPTPCSGCGVTLGGYYHLMARHSGKAVVVQGASTADGANVFQWTYGGSPANDEWLFASLGGGYYRIDARHSGKSMVVQSASTADGANVFQWPYGGATTNDEWLVQDLGGGYYRLTARHSGKALTVAGAGTADGTNVEQRTYGGSSSQQFQIVAVP
jgi:hypothetical protein